MECDAPSQTPDQQQPYNPYQNLPGARQTNEPICHFLQRLPPAQAASTNPPHLLPPWYWIANPNRSAYPAGRAENGDVNSLARDGLALLHEFKQNVAQCARNDPLRTQLREVLIGEIGAVAKRWGVTSGKWMLFPRVDDVNEVWRTVCEGVDANRLGTGAKVSTLGQEGDPVRLICVYTKDFTDVEDVRRVLLALVDMGLVRADMPRGITYKCDAYTYLDIYAKNEYGLKASVYGSKEMLAGS
ncbi:hypothetical protein C8A00DRAFT_31507 [Chaetomidium leptoderma]|uniref:DUF1917-domain-containing protein n=1 Tax=Chaetomidium leptoderma TaxID=669021 RepID=A0AAN6ZZ95_9PEZI|nr:hypothetical protein C8A00DRAFT_31507 [Chaetomidium leptoderma]